MSLEIQEEVRAIINAKLPDYDLDSSDMYWTVQGNWCYYYWKYQD